MVPIALHGEGTDDFEPELAYLTRGRSGLGVNLEVEHSDTLGIHGQPNARPAADLSLVRTERLGYHLQAHRMIDTSTIPPGCIRIRAQIDFVGPG